MRLIIRYCQPWGNFISQPVDIESTNSLQELKKKIKDRFSIPLVA